MKYQITPFSWKKYLSVGACMATLALGGCGGGSDSDGGDTADFTVSGNLLAISTNEAGLHTNAAKTITHVMAIRPSSQNTERKLATVNSDGSFSLGIDSGDLWVLVFLDSSKVGSDMIAGIYKSSDLDSLAPTEAGSADLGQISLSGTEATGTLSNTDLISKFKLSADAAALLGARDDMCLRYVNPDVDGDGVIDVNESNAQFVLDFHVRFDMKDTGSGNTVKLTDLINNEMNPASTAITYSGTSVVSGWPLAYYHQATALTYKVGGVAPGVGSQGSLVGWGEYGAAGWDYGSGDALPTGILSFSLDGGAKTLTYTNVESAALADLQSAKDLIIPFVSFNTPGGTCADHSTCTISSISYDWMKKTDTGWTPATLEELGLIVNSEGGYISIYNGTDDYSSASSPSVGYTIPLSAVSGTIDWATGYTNLSGGMTSSDLTSMHAEDICHTGISYDDKLGMRYFEGFDSTGQNCTP